MYKSLEIFAFAQNDEDNELFWDAKYKFESQTPLSFTEKLEGSFLLQKATNYQFLSIEWESNHYQSKVEADSIEERCSVNHMNISEIDLLNNRPFSIHLSSIEGLMNVKEELNNSELRVIQIEEEKEVSVKINQVSSLESSNQFASSLKECMHDESKVINWINRKDVVIKR